VTLSAGAAVVGLASIAAAKAKVFRHDERGMAIGSVFVHANPIAAEPAIFQCQGAMGSMEANIVFRGPPIRLQLPPN
jgi:hypothetical protein